MREARLEKYIKDYVYDKTGESVYLHLEDAIRITHITKRGSITLAILWANVLQHPSNYPSETHNYTKVFDSAQGGDKLILKTDDIRCTVHMSTGSLVMEGRYVYDWFTSKFKSLMDCYDESFQRTWTFIPTPAMDFSSEAPETVKREDRNTETDDYLLLLTRQHPYDPVLDKKLEDHAEDYIHGIGNVSLDQPLWEGEDLDKEIDSITPGGVRDGLTYVYTLWRSLLHKWLGDRGTSVYICNPEFDMERIRDIADISLRYQHRGHLEVIYTTSKCDGPSGRTLTQIHRDALERYQTRERTYLEYKLLKRIMLPVKAINARYIAAVKGDQVEVMVTSAGFHARSFIHEILETVSFMKMDRDTFMKQFVEPMSSPVVATTYA